MPTFNGVPTPADGQRINIEAGRLKVPDNPIIPYIEGDGIGRDIWKASQRVFDAAVEKAYGGQRRVVWYEVFAGEKAFTKFNGSSANYDGGGRRARDNNTLYLYSWIAF